MAKKVNKKAFTRKYFTVDDIYEALVDKDITLKNARSRRSKARKAEKWADWERWDRAIRRYTEIYLWKLRKQQEAFEKLLREAEQVGD